MSDTATDIGRRCYGCEIETPRDQIEIVAIPIMVSLLAEKRDGVRTLRRYRIGHVASQKSQVAMIGDEFGTSRD